MLPTIGEIVKDQIQTNLTKYRETIVFIKNALKETMITLYMNPSNVCWWKSWCFHCGICRNSTPSSASILNSKPEPEKKETEEEKEIKKLEEKIKKLKEKKEIEEKIKKKRWEIDEYLLKIKHKEQCIADLEKRLQELGNEWN